MACYVGPKQHWTFFEIDPAVAHIARDERFFTFLKSCPKDPLEIVMGDARLQLRNVDDGTYDLLAIDAFSSDAIPVHLLTREAIADSVLRDYRS